MTIVEIKRQSRTTSTLRIVGRIALTCSVLLAVANAATDEKQLETSLASKYELAKMGIERSRITKPGTVLVIQKTGLYANPSTDYGNVTNKVSQGNIAQPSGLQAALFEKATNKTLKAGETVYPTRISVKGNQVKFDVITCEMSQVNVHGNSLQGRYSATVAFEFPAGFLATADADSVKKAIDEILLPQDEAQSVKTKTVELGQTPEQVKSALGAPDKIVKLGTKEIYVYKDMKVVFVDGKVSDVQ